MGWDLRWWGGGLVYYMDRMTIKLAPKSERVVRLFALSLSISLSVGSAHCNAIQRTMGGPDHHNARRISAMEGEGQYQ